MKHNLSYLKAFLLSACIAIAPGAALLAETNVPGIPMDFSQASCFDVVAADGAVHVLFGQTNPQGELEFFYTRSSERSESWSRPVRVRTDHAPPGRHSRGNDPKLAVSGDRLLSLWTAKGSGPWGSGPLAASVSLDGGRSWQEAPAPTSRSPGEEAGYRFPAVAADAEGFHAIWIHAVDDERSLRYSRLDLGDTSWSDPHIIDPHICACCWNQLKVDPNGVLYAVYRNQEPSDMTLAISTDRGQSWTEQGPVGEFGWNFPGCPHVGAGLALGINSSSHPLLLASVWTGHAETGGTYILRSRNSGREWQQKSMPGPQSRGNINTDLALHPQSGYAAVVWDTPREDGRRAVFISTSQDAGGEWNEATELSGDDRFATHPRIVANGEGFMIFWTARTDDGTHIMRHAKIK